MPARHVITSRNSRTITGQFNSVREDGVFRTFKSLPEFLHLSILDVDPEVAGFKTELEDFDLASGRSFRPDALVEFRAGARPVFRKVAWLQSITNGSGLADRRLLIQAACEDRGADFEIVTENYWANPVRVELAKSMRHAVRRASRLEMDVVTSALQEGALSLDELQMQTGLAQKAKFAALSLCARGEVSLRRDRPLNHATLFWLTEKGS